jgi:hypothetical protein
LILEVSIGLFFSCNLFRGFTKQPILRYTHSNFLSYDEIIAQGASNGK